jgi:mono/diheme cytochrome c family protein
VDQDLMKKLFASDDHRVRAAVARILRYTGHQVPDQVEMLKKAAADPHGRVRLEAIVAASWLDKEDGLAILAVANEHPKDDWMQKPFETSLAHLNDMSVKNMVINPDGSVVFQAAAEEAKATNARLKGEELTLFQMGKAIYSREGFCITCHQPDGKGLTASGFPPLAGTKWVNGNEERFIKIVLKGLMGPIEVLGKDYPGQVPMTPYGGMLNDKEVAAVMTYVRNSFGNESSAISPDKVKAVRAAIADKTGFYSPTELLQEHPMEGE